MDDDRIEAAIEELLLFGPAPSRFLGYLDLPGVVATLGPGPEAAHNRVGMARLAPADADARIAGVLETYRSLGRGCSWFVTPRSRPDDIGARLAAHGLAADAGRALAGMVQDPSDATGDPRVASVTLEELASHASMLAEAYGSPRDEVEGTLAMLREGGAPGCSFRSYLASERGRPVAYAAAMVDDDRGVLLLGGAATLPSHRGRGLYRALVAARLADARAAGCRAVVVHARRATSAPILASLGFREVLAIDVFRMG